MKHLKNIGFKKIVICDSKGIIYKGRPNGMNPTKDEIAEITNPSGLTGSLQVAMTDADVFIGVSAANILTLEHIHCMIAIRLSLLWQIRTPKSHPLWQKHMEFASLQPADPIIRIK